MNILAVDTALGACSVAVVAGEDVLAHDWQEMARGHAEALAPMVQRAMAKAGLDFSALERLAVTTGPGTFTGQRVGLAFMRALRVALKIPVIGLTTLEVMAAQAIEESGAPWALIAHDARRGEAYLGARDSAGKIWQEPVVVAMEDVCDYAEDIAQRAGNRFAFGGTAAPALQASLKEAGLDAVFSAIAQPDALMLARLARHAPASDTPPAPLYLREADAKLPKAQMP